MISKKFSKRLDYIVSNRVECYLCKKIAETLHHLDENQENNSLKNLLPVCQACHLLIKHKEEKDTFVIMGHHHYIKYDGKRKKRKNIKFKEEEILNINWMKKKKIYGKNFSKYRAIFGFSQKEIFSMPRNKFVTMFGKEYKYLSTSKFKKVICRIAKQRTRRII